MKIIYCHSCDELFAETEMTIPGHCPVCGCGAHNMLEVIDCKRGMELSDRLIENLWMIFGDVPTLLDDDLHTVTDEEFMDWPIGTDIEDIWHWFDKAYSKGVHELMYM